jgi:hypothetical protein
MEFPGSLFAAMPATASGGTAANHAPGFDWRNQLNNQNNKSFINAVQYFPRSQTGLCLQ